MIGPGAIELARPWGLLALVSLPMIVALHSVRPRRRNVLLSTTALWREALGARRHGHGLQKLLRDVGLLAMLLAALLASLGLADPRLQARASARGDTVIVLDVSASMQTRDGAATRLDRARRAAAALVDTLPDDSRALVMSSGRDAVPRTAFESDRETLRRALSAIEPTDTAGRPREALELALALLSDRERGRVHFFTDGAFDDDVQLDAPGIEVSTVGGPARNVAITRFDLRAEVGRDDRFEVLVTLRNYGAKAVEVPLSVTLERSRLLERRIALAPDSKRTLVLPFRGPAVGRAEARLGVDDDLGADDVAFSVMGTDEALQVLIVGPGNVYLESVFEAMANVLVERHGALETDALARLASRYDIVVLDRVPAPALAPGSYLLVDTVPAGLPFRASGSLARPIVRGTGDSALVRDMDLGGLRIDAARRIERDTGNPGLQRLFWSDESDLALAFLDAQRRVVFLGFDLLRSSLPLQAAFPLLITRSVEWLRPRETRLGSTQIDAGVPFTIRLPRGQSEVIVRDPDGNGEIHRLEQGPLVYDDTTRAGLYRYTIAGVHRYFAVNLADEHESDPRARAALLAAPRAEPAGGEARVSVPLWPYLLWLALAVLLAEWCLWGVRRAGA